MKCQACNINERMNDKSLHCQVCIEIMMGNHLNMLLDGTMGENPRSEL